jgi:hypothetical protein
MKREAMHNLFCPDIDTRIDSTLIRLETVSATAQCRRQGICFVPLKLKQDNPQT